MSLGPAFFGEGNDSPIDLDKIENEYYSVDRLNTLINDKNKGELRVMVVNISSLPLNIDYLTTTLRLLNFAPDIIGLTETRITETVNSYYNPHIENYVYYPSPKSTKGAGSAGVFIKSSLVATVRHDLDISVLIFREKVPLGSFIITPVCETYPFWNINLS